MTVRIFVCAIVAVLFALVAVPIFRVLVLLTEGDDWLFVLFVAAVCALAYFIRDVVRVYRSPQFKADMARLREQRQRRRAARRWRD